MLYGIKRKRYTNTGKTVLGQKKPHPHARAQTRNPPARPHAVRSCRRGHAVRTALLAVETRRRPGKFCAAPESPGCEVTGGVMEKYPDGCMEPLVFSTKPAETAGLLSQTKQILTSNPRDENCTDTHEVANFHLPFRRKHTMYAQYADGRHKSDQTRLPLEVV
jgi:hypothetical protein